MAVIAHTFVFAADSSSTSGTPEICNYFCTCSRGHHHKCAENQRCTTTIIYSHHYRKHTRADIRMLLASCVTQQEPITCTQQVGFGYCTRGERASYTTRGAEQFLHQNVQHTDLQQRFVTERRKKNRLHKKRVQSGNQGTQQQQEVVLIVLPNLKAPDSGKKNSHKRAAAAVESVVFCLPSRDYK